MAGEVLGHIDWSRKDDEDGHRTYTLDWLIKTQDVADGPAVVMASAGLPAVGSYWAMGNDIDMWAYCWPNWSCEPIVKVERSDLWKLSQTFTTRPLRRCQDTQIENPLMEPPRLSGAFVKYTREATIDRLGNPLRSSSWEMIRGAAAEFDAHKPAVSISINTDTLPLSLYDSMMNHLNDATLWGLPSRCVKLSNVVWTRNLYGSCTYFYTITYDFDVDSRTFDRTHVDEGTRVLIAGGRFDNPRAFIQYKDMNGENGRVILDGYGSAWCGNLSPGTVIDRWSDDKIRIAFDAGHGIRKGTCIKLEWEDGGFARSRHSIPVTAVESLGRIVVDGGIGDALPIVAAEVSTGAHGTRNIAKYEESNLLLLGIPTSL